MSFIVLEMKLDFFFRKLPPSFKSVVGGSLSGLTVRWLGVHENAFNWSMKRLYLSYIRFD